MLNSVVNGIFKNRGPSKIIMRAVLVLLGIAAAVLIFFMYSRAAMSLDTEPIPTCGFTICGLEEHMHDPDCWESVLICGIEEAIDEINETDIINDEEINETDEIEETEEEYEQGEINETEEIGELEEEEEPDEIEEPEVPEEIEEVKSGHVHTEDCYAVMLVCQVAEHTHIDECYPVITPIVPEVDVIEPELVPQSMWAGEEKISSEAGSVEKALCIYCELGLPHGHVEVSDLPPAIPNPIMQGAPGFMAMAAPLGPPNPIDRWDLRNFIPAEGGIVIRDKNNEIVDLDDENTTFVFGDTYTFSIFFREVVGTYGQFDYNNEGYLIYYLPTILEANAVPPTGPILLDNNKAVGEYIIEKDDDGDYFVKVRFGNFDEYGDPADENLIYAYSNVRFWLHIAAEFRPGSEGGNVLFGADATIKIKLNYAKPTMFVAKSIPTTPVDGYDQKEETIKYEITITAPIENASSNPKTIDNLVLIDYPYIENNNSPLNGSTPNLYSDIQYRIDNGTNIPIVNGVNDFTVKWLTDSNKPRLEITFPELVKLNPGEKITVTYTLSIKDMFPANDATGRTANDYRFNLNNTVTVKSDYSEKTANAGRLVSKRTELNVTKGNVWYNNDSKTGKIVYTTTISAPSTNVFSVAVDKLTDKPWIWTTASPSATQKAYIKNAEAAYTQIQYRVNGGAWIDITDDVAWNESALNGDNRSNFVYNFAPPIELDAGDKIEVQYTLDVLSLINNNYNDTYKSAVIGNRLKYSFYIGNDVTVAHNYGNPITVPSTPRQVVKTFTLTKTGTRTGSNDYITWKTTIGGGTATISDDSALNGGEIKDTLSATGGGNISFPKKEDGTYDYSKIKIAFYNSPTIFTSSTMIGGREFTAEELNDINPGNPYFVINGLTFIFNVPKEDDPIPNGSGAVFPKIYQVVISYDTPITIPPTTTPPTGSYVYANKIEYGGLTYTHPNITVNPKPGYGNAIEKIGTRLNDIDKNTGSGNWRSTIGSGVSPLNGGVITDILDPRLSFPAANLITITLYRIPTGTTTLFTTGDIISRTSPTRSTFTAQEFIDVGALIIDKDGDGNPRLRFIVPAANELVVGTTGTRPAYSDIYRVIIEYKTNLPIPGVDGSQVIYINDIYYNKGELDELHDHAKIIVDPRSADAPTIKKETHNIRAVPDGSGYKYVIDYTITIIVPEGNEGRNIYFKDKAYAGAAANIVNYPVTNLKVAISSITPPEPLPSEPSFIYTPTNYIDAGGYWYIYFGKTDYSSSWQYNTPKKVTIEYTMPLNLNYKNENQMTVEKYLKQFIGNQVANVAELGGDYTGSSTVYDTWPIHKKVDATGISSVFDYTVILNGNLPIKLFNAGGPAEFTDTFDDRLEYVPNSFYVVAPSGTYAAADNLINVGNGTISIDLSQINSTSPDWYAQAVKYEIHYQLRLIDPDIRTPQDNIEEENIFYDPVILKNEATINSTTRGGKFSNDAEIEYIKKPPLKKYMKTDGSDVVEVEIIINEEGGRLRPDSMINEPPWFTAHDEMNGDLMFFISSIVIQTKDYNTTTGKWGVYNETAGVWDYDVNAWRDITNADKIQLDNEGKIHLYDYSRIDDRTVDFIVPDERPVKITYNAKITVEVGEESTFSNEITVYGYKAIAGKKDYKVTSTGAGAGYNKLTVYIYKQDEEYPAIKLSDAAFALYMAIPGGGYYGTGKETDKAEGDFGGYEFYWLADAVNEGGGKYSFSSEEGYLAQMHNAVYMIIETVVPIDYIKPDKNIFFIVDPMTGAQINLIESKVGALTDINILGLIGEMTVTNKHIELLDIEIKGRKKMTGTTETDEVFIFDLVEVVPFGTGFAEKPNGYSDWQSITGASDFSFMIEGLGRGEYYYRVTERRGSNVFWDYDAAEYIVRVIIANINDVFAATVEYKVNKDSGWSDWLEYTGEITPCIIFKNEYIGGPKLPETGGSMAFPLAIGGSVMILGSIGTLLALRKRRKLTEISEKYFQEF